MFCSIGSDSSVVACKLLNLLSLLIYNVRSMTDVVVDDLLVGNVDEWDEEHNRSADQAHSPEWHNLDQVVGEERSNTSLHFISTSKNKSRGG